MNDSRVLFSIVIPSFEDIVLLSSAIGSVLKQRRVDRFEIIVSDDSNTNAVENFVRCFHDHRIRYLRHKNTGNPIDNWMYGIDKAKGQFVCLLHHDESFLCSSVFDRINNELCLNENIDCFVLGAVIDSDGDCRNIRQNYFFRFVQRFFCKFVVVKNFVGPTACVFFRKSRFLPFDSSYRYLVDSIWYSEMLGSTNYKFLPGLKVLSYFGHDVQITKNIDFRAMYTREILRYFSGSMISRIVVFVFFVKGVLRKVFIGKSG